MWDKELAGYIDHTNLKPHAIESDVVELCREVKTYGFKAAVVSPIYVPLAVEELAENKANVCTIVSFPLGAQFVGVKVEEASVAIESGTQEIDMVMNIGAFLSGRFDTVEEEVRRVSEVCKARAVLKVIIETAYLDPAEIERATEIVVTGGADFVKTSTGFAPSGARVEDVRIMKATAGDLAGIKAAGGIRTHAFAWELIEAGATRLGCSTSIDVVTRGGFEST
jgi:deoxyribose-phosphate aldolase